MSNQTEFDHVILTRFSVQIGHATTFTDEWLHYRWGFFRDALIASLRTQTNLNFQWLVFFDANSPDWLRDLIADTSANLYRPIWVSGSWNQQPIRAAIDTVTTRPYLITTRIDSDDAVSRTFVDEIQTRFAHQESLYVNLMRGLQLDRSLKLFHASFAENAFISYIEKRTPGTEARTVFQCLAHEESSSFAPVLNVVGPPQWIQVIHGTNIANSVRGLRAHPRSANDTFELDLPFRTQLSWKQFALEWLQSARQLAKLWIAHPTFALVYVRALALQTRGTTTVDEYVHRERPTIVALRRIWRRAKPHNDR